MGILFKFQAIRSEVRRKGESSGDDEDEEMNAFIFQLIEIIHNIWYPLERKKARKKKKKENDEGDQPEPKMKRKALKDAKEEGNHANVLVQKINTETNNEASKATVGEVINELKTKWKQDENGQFYALLSCLLMSETISPPSNHHPPPSSTTYQESSKTTAEDIFSGVFRVKYLWLAYISRTRILIWP